MISRVLCRVPKRSRASERRLDGRRRTNGFFFTTNHMSRKMKKKKTFYLIFCYRIRHESKSRRFMHFLDEIRKTLTINGKLLFLFAARLEKEIRSKMRKVFNNKQVDGTKQVGKSPWAKLNCPHHHPKSERRRRRRQKKRDCLFSFFFSPWRFQRCKRKTSSCFRP